MSHQRTTIRDALLLLLKGSAPTYATNAGANVYSNRSNNLPTSRLPAIRIEFAEETADPRDIQSTSYIRKLQTNIEAIVEATSGYDSTLDTLCDQIEDLISGSRKISATATSSTYLGTKFELDSSGEKPIMMAILNYEITYIA